MSDTENDQAYNPFADLEAAVAGLNRRILASMAKEREAGE